MVYMFNWLVFLLLASNSYDDFLFLLSFRFYNSFWYYGCKVLDIFMFSETSTKQKKGRYY